VRSDGPSILVNGRPVPVLLQRHARARGYRLRIDRGGAARVTMPARGSEKRALAWAHGQAAWIAEQLNRVDQGTCLLRDGASFPLEGQPVTLCWQAGMARTVRHDGNAVHVGGPAELAGERVLRWLKARARTVLTAETRELAARHDLAVRSVGVGDPVSRWGSCTASGAIRYSWRLILAPPEVRISTVAHELAHLRHLDHSPAFHAFYRAICPADTVAARAWLRAHGAMLHGVRA
jgi:predicted metal-dependent hydrolase